MDQMTPDQVRQIIQEELLKNYRGGAPEIPPHQHDGVDNLKINAKNVLGLSTGGGTPGGSDKSVQYNDAGAFGGDTSPSEYFFYDKTTFTLGIPNITNADPASDTGIDSNNENLSITLQSNAFTDKLTMATSDASVSSDTSSIDIKTGAASAGQVGQINLITGDGQNKGNILIQTGTLTFGGSHGNIHLNAIGGTAGGKIQMDAVGSITLNSSGGSVSVISSGGDVTLKSASGNFNFSSGLSSFIGQGVIYIQNATTNPGSNPSSGGILYVDSGALKYRGSAGTVTPIAPA